MVVFITLICILCASSLYAASSTVNRFGTKSSWPTTWTPVYSLNDPDDGVSTSADFVGNNTYPGAYVANDGSYVYFRIRIDLDSAPSGYNLPDSIFVLIDYNNNGVLDYAFTWDAKNWAQPSKHGLELQVPGTVGSTWATTQNNDNDGDPANKVPNLDFAYNGTDGYVRTVDEQNTSDFGLTTFVDIAVSWTFLGPTKANTPLASGQTWNIQFGSLLNENDHQYISTDIAGGTNPTTPGLDWSNPILMNNPPVEGSGGGGGGVPEPATITSLLIAGTGLALRRIKR